MDAASLPCRYIYQELDRKGGAALSSTAFREVLAGAGRGEEAAWRVLYRDLGPAVIGYLGAAGAGSGTDEAGVDRLFVRLGELLPSFRGGERELRRLTFSIAHAEARERWSLVGPAPRESSPFHLLAPGELKVRLIVDLLERDERDALLLCVLGQLSVEETARILETPSDEVADLLRQSLAAIAREVASGTMAVPAIRMVSHLSRDEIEQVVAGRGEGKTELDGIRVFLISLKSAYFEMPSQDVESRHVGMAVSAARSMTVPESDPR
jgi:DNA-directed RNA polymerase specialized sigma24 family protein